MSENERVHFKIALPVELKRTLEHAAVDNRRSVSAEIIARLESSFDANKDGFSTEQVNRIVDRTVETLIKHGWQKPSGK